MQSVFISKAPDFDFYQCCAGELQVDFCLPSNDSYSYSKRNFGYPWEGTLAVVPPILPHIAL